MCGLLFSIRPLKPAEINVPDPIFDAFLETIASRGPDSLEVYTTHTTPPSSLYTLEIKLASSVLGLRGHGTTVQPLVGQRGVLGWNGQIFQGMNIKVEENDTVKVFDRLEKGEEPLDILSTVEGPYAFIYYNIADRTAHFQVDPLSRRSLLLQLDSTDRFIVASARCERAAYCTPMRALDGGEGGVIKLDEIKVEEQSGALRLDMSNAMGTCVMSNLSHPWTQVASINMSTPPAEFASGIDAEVPHFTVQLLAAVRRRIENIPPPSAGSARVCVLFSGGVDCTLLAALIHQCLPADEPVDLVNVAFQRPPQGTKSTRVTEEDYRVPDRISGIEAVEELRVACPRDWRFVEVNVPYDEVQAHRQAVLDLMYPAATEMDLSLAFPLYFASRGVGVHLSQPYHINARVYISGLGADEQLAGYARHRRAYGMGGWPRLIDEIQMDISRLPTRNLSRDDRIISSHARDARFPYLDLSFIAYLSSLPICTKCDPREEGGDKLLLRLAARSLGLIKTSSRVKRAMQFGTRSAKVGGGAKGPGAGKVLVQAVDI